MRGTLKSILLLGAFFLSVSANVETCPTIEDKVNRIVRLIKDNNVGGWCTEFLLNPEYTTETLVLDGTQTVYETSETIKTVVMSEDVEGDPTTTTSTSTVEETTTQFASTRTIVPVSASYTTTTYTTSPTFTVRTTVKSVITIYPQALRKRNSKSMPVFLVGHPKALISSACTKLLVPKTATIDSKVTETNTATRTTFETQYVYKTVPKSTETFVPLETSTKTVQVPSARTTTSTRQTTQTVRIPGGYFPTTTTTTISTTRTVRLHPACTDPARYVTNTLSIVDVPYNNWEMTTLGTSVDIANQVECCSACFDYPGSSCIFSFWNPANNRCYVSAAIRTSPWSILTSCPADFTMTLNWALPGGIEMKFPAGARYALGPCVPFEFEGRGNVIGNFPMGIPPRN